MVLKYRKLVTNFLSTIPCVNAICYDFYKLLMLQK